MAGLENPTAATNDAPTGVRHRVVAVSMLMAALLYLDRFCVGMAEPFIKQDLGLSTFEVGLLFSAFFLTYALCQVPSGWLSDRFGPRMMLAVYILAWSLFTGLLGLAASFVMLILMRAAMGVGQAGAYPTSANILSKWIPFRSRGKASSCIAFGGRLGGAIAPVLTAVLIVLFVPIAVSPTTDPSLLSNESLVDGAGLCIRLRPEDGEPLSAELNRVNEQMSQGLHRRISAVAAECRPLFADRKKLLSESKDLQDQWRWVAAWEKTQQAAEIQIPLSDIDRQRLVDALNKIVRNPEFYEPEVFDGLKSLDRVAIKFMKRANAAEKLTETENQRFNRLLLEGCFPDEIGKVYVDGWRPVMFTYGFVGLFVAGIFWVTIRNRPDEHSKCNHAEQELILSGRPANAPGPHGRAGKVPWRRLLTSRSMWLNCFGQVGTNIGWVFLVTWFPRYLLEEHSVPILQRGIMASIPLFVGWFGMLGGGFLTDFLVSRVGLKWGRRIPWSFSRFIGVIAFLLCPVLDSPWAVTAALSVVAFSTDLGTASGWAYCQDVGGRYVGSVLGWGNMWGNLGATVSPILLAVVFAVSWKAMFWVCAGSFLFAGLCALGIDATIPIAPPDEDDEEAPTAV